MQVLVFQHSCRVRAHYCACTGLPSHTSFIFYAGLEGMGGLDLETDEDENVRGSFFCSH